MVLDIISLLFSIIGAVLLWKYGLIGVTGDGSISIVAQATPESKKESYKVKCWSRIGLILTILGIILQNDLIKSVISKICF
jgi:hypothetical protein